ncbi:MAG: ComEC/Rec2 family competence protein, partial [Eubacteriales bacterium]|nr:ComEC/Rec2 family competence protein [Eubacteriales bacterium]
MFFICGILSTCVLTEDSLLWVTIALCAVFVGVCLYKRKFIFPIFLCFAFILGGLVMQLSARADDTFSAYNQKRCIVEGTVKDCYMDDDNCVATLRVDKIDHKKIAGDIRLYVEGGQLFEYGDRICVMTKLSIPTKPRRADEVDYRAYNYSRGIYASGYANWRNVVMLERGGYTFSPEGIGFYSRRAMKDSINKTFPSEQAGILIALMLGDKSGVTEDLKETGINVGIYHTMSTSGLHLSILLTFFALIINNFCYSMRKMAIANIFLVILMYIVIGYSPGIARAVLMALIVCLSSLTYRKADSYTSLALSAGLILCLRPYALFDAGFLLSFCSSLGILIIYNRFFNTIKNKALSILAVSVGALLGTMAITAQFFERVTVVGLIANVLIVPISELLLPLGYISAVLTTIFFPLGDFFSYMIYPLIDIYVYVARWFEGLAFSSVEV